MANEKAPGLVAKMATIMGELGNIEKKGHNKAQNYEFVRESDVVAAVVPLLAKHKIMLHTSVTSHDRSPLYQTQSGMTMWMTTVTVDGTWIDGESGETLPAATFVGTGADTGDKGVYKAMTGAEKYMLMKTFLISTGDDPESDEKVDKAAAVAGAAAGPVTIKRGAQAGVERGGKASVVTSAQVKEIVRLVGELELDAEGFAAVVTRVLEIDVEGKTGKEILSALTADQAKSLIAALTATPVEPAAEEQDDTDDGLAIV